MKTKLIVLLLIFLISTSLCANAASSESYPKDPIHLIVSYGAGGGTDLIMRSLADAMTRATGWEIQVTNMPGAIGSIATDFVWNKPADGYWLLAASLYNKGLRVLGYHESIPWKDWQFHKIANSIQSFSVLPNSPVKDFGDLIEMAKNEPKKIKVSNSGVGGIWHEGVALISDIAGVKFNNVPYDGGAPATLALLKNEVDVAASGLHEQMEFIKAGQIRPLAVMAPESIEIEGYGTVPSIKEYLPKLEDYLPFGATYVLAFKREVPDEIARKIREAFIEASNDQALKDMFKKRHFLMSVATGVEADRQAALSESITAYLYWDIGIAKINPRDLGIPKPSEFADWWPPADYEPALK